MSAPRTLDEIAETTARRVMAWPTTLSTTDAIRAACEEHARNETARLREDLDKGARDYCAMMERHDALANETARLRAERRDNAMFCLWCLKKVCATPNETSSLAETQAAVDACREHDRTCPESPIVKEVARLRADMAMTTATANLAHETYKSWRNESARLESECARLRAAGEAMAACLESDGHNAEASERFCHQCEDSCDECAALAAWREALR